MSLFHQWLSGWTGLTRPESSAITAQGSKLKILPASLVSPYPVGVEINTSDDNVTWDGWVEVVVDSVVDIVYPGYFKLRTRNSGEGIRYINYKDTDEMTSITGITVAAGGMTIE